MEEFKGMQRNTCSICKKQLASKQNLKQHMNIHSGDKPYKCNFEGCEKAYKHSSQLSNHKYVHQQNRTHFRVDFDDFKGFIQLILLALNRNTKKILAVPNGPYSIEEVKLPSIGNPQNRSKLPEFSEVI